MRPLVTSIAILLAVAGILLGSAGSPSMPWLWAYVALIGVTFAVLPRVIGPDLVRERLRPGPGGVDRHLRAWVSPFLAAHLVVAGLDAGRFHWSGAVPTGVRVCGAAGLVGMFAAAVWTIRTNRFFSPVVRIQHERGHHLITDGPYSCVRHPGYAVSILGFPFGSLLMGSYWSLLPLLGAAALLLRRTILEDRFLHEHLEGYREYAARVRFRLLPGIW
ncbi:MAG: isoprenylcysteine carboxylmethyltransferase family protein [Phycisphaerales bacterium]|nr:MAG: isoprenylcysteine carboxylmethyltransferase family protein [Phycisphaerales bacterium]